MFNSTIARVARYLAVCVMLICVLSSAASAQSITSASTLYSSNINGTWSACTGCHLGAAPPSTAGNVAANHLTASNNFTFLKSALSPGGAMYAQINGTLPTDDQIKTLTMYIGQYKAPIAIDSSTSTAQNVAKVVDVYPLLLTDGSSGVADASGLSASTPSHGTTSVSINTGTIPVQYNITYTPTAGYSGSDSFTFTISNAAGSTTKTMSVTVAPIPVISTPTFVNLQTGVAITTPIQIVASNTPTSYGMSPIPDGLTFNAATGAISGTPTTPATTNVTLSATNANGTGTLVVPFTVGTPTPGACAQSTNVDTPVNIVLTTCFGFTDTAHYTVTGMTILTTPSHGTVTISGSTARYTPAAGFFGTDSFTAKANFQGVGLSASGTVSLTVSGRPDPTKDTAVVAGVNSQSEAALQAVLTQTSNIQAHLTGIRTRLASGSSGTSAVAFRRRDERPAKLTLSEELASVGKNDVTQLPGTAAKATLPVSAGVATVASATGLSSNPIYNIASSLVQNQQLNLGTVSSALDSTIPDGTLPGPKIWAEGVISYGARDATGSTSATDYNTAGITFGTDFTLTKQVVTGMAIGFAKGTTNIGTDGTQSRSRGTSVAFYGSYQPEGKGFVEGLIGLSTLDYDLQRYVTAASDFALSNRKGLQLFGSLGGGWEFRDKGRMLSPYGRIDFSTGRLNETTETGAGSYALKYDDQTISSLQGSLGLSVESTHSTSFGWAVPRARVELRKDLQNKSEATISYADQVGGTRYTISPTGTLNSAVVLGVGSNFIFKDGWGLGLDYQLTQASATESSYALRLKLVKQLGVKGLPDLLAGVEFEPGDDDGDWQIDAGSTWDDNITRAKAGSDVRSDSIYSINASRSATVYRAGNSRMVLTGVAGGERFQSTNGLSNVSLTGEAVYQYRASSDFDTPTYGIFGRVTALKHQSNLRDGARLAIGLTAMQPFTDRLTGFVGLSHNRRAANSTVFTTVDTSLRGNLDLALRGGVTLYVTGEYRSGDIVSTGRSSLENITIANALVQDDAYTGGQFFSYRFGGSTLLTTLGYNVGLGPRDSIDIAWRRVESTPTVRPSWATSPNSYITNQVSASYLMRF